MIFILTLYKALRYDACTGSLFSVLFRDGGSVDLILFILLTFVRLHVLWVRSPAHRSSSTSLTPHLA
jgi:hypothetical protein